MGNKIHGFLKSKVMKMLSVETYKGLRSSACLTNEVVTSTVPLFSFKFPSISHTKYTREIVS